MRNGIWVRTLNVLNLKYGLLVHNSAKVVPLQVFGKSRLLLPYTKSPLIVFYQTEFRALRRLLGKSPKFYFTVHDGAARNHGDADVHGGTRAGG